jgi:DNA-binding CsgD family transcriptional regulator
MGSFWREKASPDVWKRGRGARRPRSPRMGTRSAKETFNLAAGKQVGITEREREVLTWAARGLSSRDTGEVLDIAKRTVDEHMQTAARKLGAANKTHAVAIAIRDRLIEVDPA